MYTEEAYINCLDSVYITSYSLPEPHHLSSLTMISCMGLTFHRERNRTYIRCNIFSIQLLCLEPNCIDCCIDKTTGFLKWWAISSSVVTHTHVSVGWKLSKHKFSIKWYLLNSSPYRFWLTNCSESLSRGSQTPDKVVNMREKLALYETCQHIKLEDYSLSGWLSCDYHTRLLSKPCEERSILVVQACNSNT